MAFIGTKCVKGSSTGVVVQTGPNSIIGRLNKISVEAILTETSIWRDFGKLIRFIALFTLYLE